MDQTSISQAFSEAPQALQEYLKSKDFETRIIQFATDLELPPTSFLPLKNASVYIFLNLADSNDLVETLQKALSLDEARAAFVAKKIDELVLEEIQQVLREKAADTIKDLKLGSASGNGSDLRASMLASKEGAAPPPKPAEPKVKTSRGETSRTLLMDQLSLIGQIPKDEDVLQRLNKIKEQIHRGEAERARIDAEIRAREETEKIKTLETNKVHVQRKIYDVDPYREHFGVEDKEL